MLLVPITVHEIIRPSLLFFFFAGLIAMWLIIPDDLFRYTQAVSSNGGKSGKGHSTTILSSTSKTTSTSSNGHTAKGSAVVLVPINSGDPTLDKHISKFYSCISKTHQDPPTKDQVDSCYFQIVGGYSGSGGGSQSADAISTNSGGDSHSKTGGSSPGVLVEVP